jgi:hypothetical protein
MQFLGQPYTSSKGTTLICHDHLIVKHNLLIASPIVGYGYPFFAILYHSSY